MPALALLSSDPTDGATGVTIEQVITLTFNQDLRTSSVTAAVVQLFRDDADFPLPGGLAAAGDKITFIPDQALHEDALYKVKVIGSDLGLPFSLQASDGTLLSTTIDVTFRTGQELYVPLSEVAGRDDIEQIGPIRQQDPLFATPTAVVLGALTIEDRDPDAFEKVSVDITAVVIDFDRAIDPASVSTATVEVNQFPVLGIEEWYGSIPVGNTDVMLAVQQNVDLTPPTGTLVVEDDKVKFVIDPSGVVLHNTEFQVTVSGVQGLDGSTLASSSSWLFTTDLVPLYISPQMLRMELGAVVADLPDDTLCKLIHKCSIETWEESGRAIPLTKPTIQVRKWVECKVILDILAVKRLGHDLGAGEQKTLGDLTIRRAPSDPLLNMKYKQATECLKEIMIDLNPGRISRVAVKGSASGVERHDFRMRTWDHLLLSSLPAANTPHERGVKQWLSADYSLAGKRVHVQSGFAISVGHVHH